MISLILKTLLVLMLLFLLSACGSTIPRCPKCEVYTGDSRDGSLVRKQDGKKIPVESPAFNQVKAFTDEGFEAFIKTYVNGCKSWGN